MVQLHRGHRLGGAHLVGQPAEPRHVAVVADAQLALPRLPLGGDVRRARHHQPEAAAGPGHQPATLVVAERAVGVALLVGQRGHGQPVAPGGSAEQVERGGGVGLQSILPGGAK